VVESNAELLGIEALARPLASLHKKFAALDCPFAVFSLRQWFLPLVGFSYSEISEVIRSSIFYRDPSQRSLISEFLRIAALVRPSSVELYLQLIGKLNSKDKFKSTLRRMCLSY
jgi:hypothetical protein